MMNEVKSPKKPLIFYYLVAMLLVMLFNFIAMPWLSQYQIQEVDYNTFVDMTEKGEIDKVEIQEQDNRILFTGKDGKSIYKTAMISTDSQLVQRLLDAGVSTTGEEIEQTSLLVQILGWVAPILIFIALGQFMSRKLIEKMGGSNSMMFNMGKSNAKVYVKSAEGIKFDDVAGEDEAKENLTEIVNYLHNPKQYQDRRLHAEGRAPCRPSGHRQDHAGQGRSRRGQCALLLHVRLRICGNVCRHGRQQGP